MHLKFIRRENTRSRRRNVAPCKLLLWSHIHSAFSTVQFIAFFSILALFLIGTIFLFSPKDLKAPSILNGIKETTIELSNTQKIEITEIPVSFTIPKEYSFSKELGMNYTTNEAYSVSFIIQNYVSSPIQSEEPYQLYGLYQWDTPKLDEKAFNDANYELEESSIKKSKIDGKPSISGITKGTRGRYTIYIFVNGHILKLAADGVDERHILLTDGILATFKFLK